MSMEQNISTALNTMQQHCANRPRFSALLLLGMDRTQQRQARRRAALQNIRRRFKSNQQLADALGEGFSPSYVSQLLSGHRGIGDDVATKIESRLGLESGELDDANETKITTQDQSLMTVVDGFNAASESIKTTMLLLAQQALVAAKSEAEREIMTPATIKNDDILDLVDQALLAIRLDFGGKIPVSDDLPELIALQIRRELEQRQKLGKNQKKKEHA